MGRSSFRSVLRRPEFRRLWTAQTVSRWGDTFNIVALALLVFGLTGSGVGVSGVVVAEILPVLMFAPFAGSIVDRLPRVRVMVAADLVRVALAALLPLANAQRVRCLRDRLRPLCRSRLLQSGGCVPRTNSRGRRGARCGKQRVVDVRRALPDHSRSGR